MAHTIEKRWSNVRMPDGSVRTGVNESVGQSAENVLRALSQAEELYQQLTEMVAFAGPGMQAVADQLFKEEIAARNDVQASAEEVAMVQDAAAAATALHNLYQCMTGGTVAADDRAAKLRRMI